MASQTTTAYQERIQLTNAYNCLDCGKCTGVCPVSRHSLSYSPRNMVTRAIRDHGDALVRDYDLWSCLTCWRCESVCPANVRYSDLTQIIRTQAQESGFKGKCSHSGALDMLQQLMTQKDLHQKRLEWIPEDIEYSVTDGEVLYFVGCAPYFNSLFSDLDISILDGAVSSLSILNRLGITPVLMEDERCCGHDLLWNGDVEHFKMLAKHSVDALNALDVKTVLFSCAECLSTFSNLYSSYGFQVKADLKHMSQFLAEQIDIGSLKLADGENTITYQDPCRLGRHMGIIEEPRKVLQPNGSNHLQEMKQNRNGALCCGVSAWMNCDITSKTIQSERLRQAKDTGADILAVACPKCQIHLACTLKDPNLKDQYAIKIQDIARIALDRMEGACRESD